MKKPISVLALVLFFCATWSGVKGQIVSLGVSNNPNDTVTISNAAGWQQLEVFEMWVHIQDTFSVNWIVPGLYCDSARVTFSPQTSGDTATIDTSLFQQRAKGRFALQADYYTIECWAWSDSCFNEFFEQTLQVFTNISGVNDFEEGRTIKHVCISTEIDAGSNEIIVVYPNPVQSGKLVRLTCPEGDEIFKITVSDLTGRTVQCFSSNDMATIATDCLSAGMYYVSITTKNGAVLNHRLEVIR